MVSKLYSYTALKIRTYMQKNKTIGFIPGEKVDNRMLKQAS